MIEKKTAREIGRERDDLVLLVRRFIRVTRSQGTNIMGEEIPFPKRISDLRAAAADYLKRKGLQGNILR